ncbi:MAG: M3 family metallopeptidase [Myxococcota bacterium]
MSAAASNPIVVPWVGQFGGVPAFDKVKVEDLQAAVEYGMAAELADVEAIANNPAPPTFENTIAAMEDTGRVLSRVFTVYGVMQSTMSSPESRAIATVLSPRMAAFSDKITQNEALFKRIAAVYEGDEYATLTAEQQRLTWKVHTRFKRYGAGLGVTEKARLGVLNQELAALYTSFGQNLLADEETWVVLETQEDLAGLPESYVASAAAQAAERELEGKWVVVNTRSSVDPFLTFSTRRDLRERVWKAYINRGDNGDAHDNNQIITTILKLRHERAQLLGYETYAHWKLADSMAGDPAKAMALMTAVWEPAVARVREEVADQQALANSRGDKITIEPWDYRFYQELVRKDRYDLDQNEVKPYMELENLREGMFWAAGELYGLKFEPVTGLPVIHPDVRVWEVKNAEGGHVGLWYFDPYARQGKRSGAWMNAYRRQEAFKDTLTPIVSNNSNFVKGGPGEPVLISGDDARTLFHEFGHALHGLLSDVTYPSLSGTSVARDYVEFPSQLNERWFMTPEVLNKFALHYETGEAIPPELVKKMQSASKFNQGFGTVEYLASALVDMKLHLAGGADIDPDAFEKQTLTELGMPKELVMRHRTPQFAHVFSGDGYAAGYYSYLWADTLTADAAEAFTEAGSMYDDDTAARLVENVLSVGDTRDPAEAFRAYRGRDVEVDALMRARGFPVSKD